MTNPTVPLNNRDPNDILIEDLGLPAEAIVSLHRVGMVMVQDCIEFYERGADAMITVPPGVLEAFYSHVLPALNKLGYVDDAQ